MNRLRSGKKGSCWAQQPSIVGQPGNVVWIALALSLQWLGADVALARTEYFSAMVQLNASVGNTQRVGSGFVVAIEGDSAYVVTANHVVEGRADQLMIEARFFTDILRARLQVRLVDQDLQNDLALLRIWPVPRDTRALPLATSLAPSGTTVQLIGFPLGTRVPVPTYGQVSLAQGSRLRVDARADEGNSGGPMLAQGYVQGVVVEVGHLVGVVPAPIVNLLVDGVVARSARSAEVTWTHGGSSARDLDVNRGAGTCRVIYQSGALRSINVTPSRKSTHAGSVPEGSPIQVIRREAAEGQTWFRVRTQRGLEGWIPADQIDGCG